MAAPSKVCKSERRFLKKLRKSQYTLQKQENITIINEPSCHLVVSNAGLGNGVSREVVNKIFAQLGTVVSISMKPDKSHCFVSMANEESAVHSYNELNGRLLKCPEEVDTPGLRFYLSYVESVPENEVVTGDMPAGLRIIEDFISEGEEQRLLQCVDWTSVDKNITTGGKSSLKHRRVKHYGYEFMYTVNNVDINHPLEVDIPPECSNIIDRILENQLIAEKPDQLTINQYQPGQGIPPHIDTHSAFTDGIVSLSLGSQAVMDFRHPDGRHVPVLLPQRSLAVMTGESRYVWSHGITQRKSDILPVSKIKDKLRSEMPLVEPSALVKVSSGSNSRHTDNIYTDSTEHLEKDRKQKLVRDFPNVPIQNDNLCFEQSTTCGDTIDVEENDDFMCARIGGVTVDKLNAADDTRTVTNQVQNSRNLTLVHRGVRTSFTFRKVLRKPCTCNYPEQCDSQQSSGSSSDNKTQFSHESSTESEKPSVPETELDAQRLEFKLVHQVYEEIAGHFSDTRHSPWPCVVEFLKFVPQGSVILDVGCGNGKYLGASKNNIALGCDRSENLCKICKSRGFPVFVCDCLAVPVRSQSVDVAISIAVIHHLSTKERRLAAVKELVRILCIGGQALIYVWALEQELNKKKSTYLKDSAAKKLQDSVHGNAEDNNLDNYKDGDNIPQPGVNLNEGHYDLQEKPQVRVDVGETSGASKKKTLSVHKNRTAFESQDLLVPWHLRQKTQKKEEEQVEVVPSVFHRYYHVFRQGELEELCKQVAGIELVKSYYDQGNWCVILKKVGPQDLA